MREEYRGYWELSWTFALAKKLNITSWKIRNNKSGWKYNEEQKNISQTVSPRKTCTPHRPTERNIVCHRWQWRRSGEENWKINNKSRCSLLYIRPSFGCIMLEKIENLTLPGSAVLLAGHTRDNFSRSKSQRLVQALNGAEGIYTNFACEMNTVSRQQQAKNKRVHT